MAASPEWKVYDAEGKYVASVVSTTLAAVLVVHLGGGATIRYLHGRPVWTEGKESISAGESYDEVDRVCAEREHEHWLRRNARYLGVTKSV